MVVIWFISVLVSIWRGDEGTYMREPVRDDMVHLIGTIHK